MLKSKRRAIVYLCLSFVLALLASILVLQQVQALNEDLGGMTEVYIADSNIPSRTAIVSEHITTTTIPNRYVTSTHITNEAQLEGQVSLVPLSEGDMITTSMLKPYTELSNENNREVRITSNDHIIMDQQLKALDRADIVVSHDFEGEDETEVFMTDVPVTMVTNSEEEVSIFVEVPFEEVAEVIHVLNYAENIQVLKANVGQGVKEEELNNGENNDSRTENEEDEAEEDIDEGDKEDIDDAGDNEENDGKDEDTEENEDDDE